MFLKGISYAIISLYYIGLIIAQTVYTPILDERSYVFNVTGDSNTGYLIQGTSKLRTSQDFQGIKVDSNPKQPPNRIVFNFDYGCLSTNTTIENIRQINQNSMEVASIQYAQRLALVKRGHCVWSEKISTVNRLSSEYRLNVTAFFIYDNATHPGIESIYDIDSVSNVDSGSFRPASSEKPLPDDRSVLKMKDNDIDESISTTVYFIPNAYGTYLISKLNATYNESNPNSRSYTVITPYLDEYKWDYRANIDNFFSSGRGYLAYIIALAAIFLIAMIFLRWWRIRRIRDGLNNGDFDGSNNTFNMQRVNRLDPLPVDVVNSLPIEKYSEDLITNVNCAICLEDYVPGKNDIRILPCHHGFCVLCIDPWLTQKSTLCPICKWDCLPVNLREERDNAIQHQGAADSNSPTYVINMTPPMPDPSSSHSTGNNTTGTPNEVPGQSINMNEITDNTNISSHETLQSSNEKQPIITPNNHDQPSSPPYPTTSTSTNTNNTVTDTATPTLNSHSPTIRENITPNEKDTKL